MSTYITLAEAKSHLRVDFTDDDTYIQGLCDMAEEVVLNEIRGTISGKGTVSYTSGSTSLTGVETNFMDYTTGDVFTIKGNTTRYDLTVSGITDNNNLDFTSGFATTEDGLSYTVNMGLPLGTGTLPLALKHAMLLMVGHFYMVREPIIIGVTTSKIPYAFDFLIAPFKNWVIV